MLQRAILSISILVFAPDAFAQTPDILWARGGTAGTLVPSTRQDMLLFTTLEGWEAWPLSNAVIPERGSSFADTDHLSRDVAWTSVSTKGGHEIISACGERIIAWNPDSNKFTLLVSLPSEGIPLSIDATPDGNFICVSYEDSMEYLFDRIGDSLYLTVKAKDRGRVSISSDGTMLLAATANSILSLIDIPSKKEVRRFGNIFNTPQVLAFNPKRAGTFIVWDNDLKEMDTSGAILAEWGSENAGGAITFSPSGSSITSEQFNILNGAQTADIIDLKSHAVTPLPFPSASFFNEDTLIVPGPTLYSISRHEVVQDLGCTPTFYGAFSADGKSLVAGSIFDAKNGAVRSLSIVGGRSSTATGYHAVTGGGPNGEIYFWSDLSDTGVQLRSGICDTSAPTVVAVSPDDSEFAVATQIYSESGWSQDERNAAQIWNGPQRRLVATLDNPLNPIFALVFSNSGSFLAASDPNNFYVWDSHTGKRLATLNRSDAGWGGIGLIAFMPGDSALLVNGTNGYEIRNIFNSATEQIPHDGTMGTVIRLPDGKYVGGFALGHFNNYNTWNDTIEWFDLATNKILKKEKALDSSTIFCMAVSPQTGDVSIGSQDLIVYRGPETDAVKDYSQSGFSSLSVYASHSRIVVREPELREPGEVFIYDELGTCCFWEQLSGIEESITTGVLPAGDYFIVLKHGQGEREFTKVSLF